MATNAQYTKNARQASVVISTANTNRDGTGTMTIVWTAPAFVDATNPGGSRIERVVIQATGTTTAGMVRLFVSSDAAGNTAANTFLYEEVPVTAATPSTTVQAYATALQAVTYQTLFPIMIAPGSTLRVSTANAESFIVTAMGGDY
jgi:hypothetical protein